MLVVEQLVAPKHGRQRIYMPELNLKSGDFCGVVGPNGAGKSSFLKAMTGELASNGHIDLHGKSLSSWKSLARARHVAVLPQASELSFAFTAEEVVALGATPLRLSKADKSTQINKAMCLAQCEHLAKRDYPRLSGGEKQRVQLARVLLQISQAEQTPLLLLDEPTSAQDLGQQHAILTMVKSLCETQGYMAIAVLHDVNHVLHYCSHAMLINQGQADVVDTPAAVLTPDNIGRAWGYIPSTATLDSGQTLLF